VTEDVEIPEGVFSGLEGFEIPEVLDEAEAERRVLAAFADRESAEGPRRRARCFLRALCDAVTIVSPQDANRRVADADRGPPGHLVVAQPSQPHAPPSRSIAPLERARVGRLAA
jgi:hypothetical protein